MAFAQNLNHLMDICGLTKYKLAKILNCHQTTVQNWLEGSEPQKRSQIALADYFGITVSELMGDALPSPKKENKPTTKGELDNNAISDIKKKMVDLVLDMPDEVLIKWYDLLEAQAAQYNK